MKALSSIAHTEGFSVAHTATVLEAMSCMLENRNGSVVLLEERRPAGIVTEGVVLDLLEEGIDFEREILPYAKAPVITASCNRPVESAFDLVVTNNIRRLVLVDEKGEYTGMVLQEDLFAFLEEDVYKVDLKVGDLLPPDAHIVSAGPEESLGEVLHLMRVAKVGSVIVKKEEEVLGIVTEKDILAAGYNKIDMQKSVTTLMSSPVLSVNADAAVTSVITMMQRKNIRRVLVRDRQGRMHALLTNRDIFKHIKGNVARMLEIKLRHAKEIMDLLPEAIIEIYDTGKNQVIHWINSRARDYFGDSVLEKSPEALFGETWARLYSVLAERGQVVNFSALLGGRHFEFSGTLSKNINSRYIKLIAKDVTEHESIKRQLQAEVQEESRLRLEHEYLMMQQARLASMGEMVGHIAHQWRQPLAQLGGILMNLESAQAFGELDEAYLGKRILEGNELIKYMSRTIDDFRHFFSPKAAHARFDVAGAIKQAVRIVSAALDYQRIQVTVDAPEGHFFARGLENEFAQVILNMLNNAKEALSQREHPRRIMISAREERGEIIVTFCDNGGGIDPQILPDIFKPYVTTRSEEGGTGIGLYMAQLIIEQKMHGSIGVSNSAEGACFTLKFPEDEEE